MRTVANSGPATDQTQFSITSVNIPHGSRSTVRHVTTVHRERGSFHNPLFLRLGRLTGESEPIASNIVSLWGEGIRILRRVSTECEW